MFTFLPVHAAGIYDGRQQDYCSQYVVSSYAPTLSALQRAQNAAPTLIKSKSKLACIAAAKPHKALPTLAYVDEELDHIRKAAIEANIAHYQDCSHSNTVSEAMHLIKSTNLVHITCHGVQDVTNPLSSGFCLADGDLTVSQLADLDLKGAFFAFLSACETAKGDRKQPDQTVHLAATMLFVGFKSVIATMWYVPSL
jgi:CHAT domain-containing protein